MHAFRGNYQEDSSRRHPMLPIKMNSSIENPTEEYNARLGWTDKDARLVDLYKEKQESTSTPLTH